MYFCRGVIHKLPANVVIEQINTIAIHFNRSENIKRK